MAKKEVRIEDLDEDQRYALAILSERSSRSSGLVYAESIAQSLMNQYLDSVDDGSMTNDNFGLKRRGLQLKYAGVFRELKQYGLAEVVDKPGTGGSTFHGAKITKRGIDLTTSTKKSNLVSRVSAFIFFVVGFSFMVASDFSSTGHVVAGSSQAALKNIPALLSVLLASIGGYLFVKSK